MEDLAHDLPFTFEFEQREHICVPSAVQIGEFELNGGNRLARSMLAIRA